MLVSRVGRARLGWCFTIFVLGLLGRSSQAIAQGEINTYVGFSWCASCHEEEYYDWAGHGHAWMSMSRKLPLTLDPIQQYRWRVGNTSESPPADLFAPVGVPLNVDNILALLTGLYPSEPDPWVKVDNIFGHFKSGAGNLLLSDGRRQSVLGGNPSTMPGRCNKCHNTAAIPTGSMPGTTIQGTWKVYGIQCEQCHGPGDTMEVPAPDRDGTNKVDMNGDTDPATKLNLCRDCHSAGDFGRKLGSDPYMFGFRISVAPTPETTDDPNDLIFAGHHAEGDEFRRSPHKNLSGHNAYGESLGGCTNCHDPHKSVWKDEGGIKYADPHSEESIGMMCTRCHDKRIRGAMGEFLVCLDCHMPEASALGHRRTHLWKINTAPKRNWTAGLPNFDMPNDEQHNWKEELNDSGGKVKYWMNYDGTTGAGDSFITLDMVCVRCHDNLNLEQLSRAARYIHRQPGLVDLTINGGDNMQFVTKSQQLSVDYALYPEGNQVGMVADVWILNQGPSGWKYFNPTTKAWKSGMKVSQKGVALNEMSQNVFKGKLTTGSYTYWVQIFPTDGSEYVDSVPVYVSKK